MTTFKEALEQSLNYFGGDDIAANVYVTKYALTSPDGDILEPTPDMMHRRLAKEFARIEKKYPNPISEEEIFGYLDKFKYIIPQGSPMSGIGNPFQFTSISNCFVIESPYDSYGGILKTDQEQVQLMKRRGGVGFDISTIRPKGMQTSNAAKTTDGIGLFMERFSNTCREVAQGGRRGALMLSISVHHPEIRTFINIKKDLKKVTGANISIRLTDEFMNAVEADEEYEVRWPVDSSQPTIRGNIKASEIWNEINESAHAAAEPGLLFWDNIKKFSPADAYEEFQTTSTNPCGEIVLSPYDSCRLLLVNALSFVTNPFEKTAEFDYKKFGEVVQVAQRLMDDMIDLELECIDAILFKIEADLEPEEVKAIEYNLWKKIRSAAERGRRTGLGLTAIGDTLAACGVVYGTEQSVEVIEQIYKTLAINSYRSSVTMAKERGAFPAYDYETEKDHPFINRIMSAPESGDLEVQWKLHGRRNIANTTTAPAGSVSICTQSTSGIEPVFSIAHKRRKKINPSDTTNPKVDFIDDMGDKWQEFDIYHHGFAKWKEVTGLTEISDSPYFQATANDIDWVMKVKAQAAAQHWICHSISNTTNVPKDTTVETVKDIYMAGWKMGCKGVTIYRDGCRAGVLVTEPVDDFVSERNLFTDNQAPKRPELLPCDIYHMTVKGEKWNAFVGMLDGRPYEIFAGRAEYVSIPKSRKQGTIKKNGKYNVIIGEGENEIVIKDLAHIFENSTESAFTRTISLALRHGTPVQFIVEQLDKGASKENDMFSLSKGLMRVLKSYIKDGTTASTKKCPACGATDSLVYQDGCMLCSSCGDSKCG